MRGSIPPALLCLFIVNLGIACGAGLYEHRIVFPDWLSVTGSGVHWNAQAAARDDTGLRFWVFVTTVPLTVLTFANLAAAWRSFAGVRAWWMAAAMTALADRVLTFGYFIPTMVSLLAAPDSPEAVEMATRWSALNHGRHVLVLIAWLCALRSFWLLARASGRRV